MPALMLPVQSGMTQPARELLGALGRCEAGELSACCERLGIERMTCYLAVLPTGDQLVIHVQGCESAHSFRRLAVSRHPFDRRLCASLTEITGQDIGRSDAVQWLLPLIDVHATRATQVDEARQRSSRREDE